MVRVLPKHLKKTPPTTTESKHTTDSDAAIAKALAAVELGGREKCPMRCTFQSSTVSTHQRVNCKSCGKRLRSGEKTEKCLCCPNEVCSACAVSSLANNNSISSSTRSGSKYAMSSGSGSSKSKHMCIVPCVVGRDGVCIEMMIDSGASASVISLSLARRLQMESRIQKSNGTAYGVGKVKILGHIRKVPCILGSVEFPIDFLVLEMTDQEMLLLGLDQMRKYKCIIDLERNIILFGGNGGVEVPLLAEKVEEYSASV
mmetsp:Transcript_17894/g.27116  ORF Transcript_17894/g.27116 Transcript_17894/m.27116 type:complete len:258 (+) Transcript_17894:221-994(+)|eukprot:CAMPEP_0178917184 /NCGR_PEP_ID=MMETSP0786-20121207/13102_1 /TAXON_ID=186022 /ORGANISM="Thalassionema frauenfeldii, Strain CCMP 1798" /LENGTH=257 /DNA_ID=CAMNT_0020590699 /DNA_START=135 /DNA_END=908 /DNA_ORIENTATION=+